MDIEEVARKTPNKIITTKVDFENEISDDNCEKIVKIFNLNNQNKNEAIKLIKSIYKMFMNIDSSMV